jgi:tRNA(Arg) A34 adenosine deaminase TadA
MCSIAVPVLEAAMREALAEARLAAEKGELPFGAVIVAQDGRIVARTQDSVARTGDPTRHAEIDSVRLAVAAAGGDLSRYALVSNVEPCAMCSTAAWWARIGGIAFGLSVHRLKEIRPDAVDEPGPPVEQIMSFFERRPVIVPGLLAAECEAVWRHEGR